ncbi:MAG: 30S ribosomal protein S13 [Cyanobacteriota bacterium]|nr:MAG: 30S ribosomal protein S13 [Cyanobacteriota bacterium]
MFILNQLILKQKKTTYSSLKGCYGIGDKTSKKLNSILLNNPQSKEFKHDLNKLVRTPEGKNIFSLPSEVSLKSREFDDLLKKAEIKTYQSFRQFQNLPSRGQRTHTNSQTSKKGMGPMFRLKINKEVADNLYTRYKKLEFLRNGRSDEYNNFVKNETSKKKLSRNKLSQKEKQRIKASKTKSKGKGKTPVKKKK